jgi:uncharacterized protein YciU (UPF0263 family)
MEKIEMNVDREAFEDSVIVTFDKRDTEIDDIVAVGGYVQVRQNDDGFQVLVFNSEGDIVAETEVPFEFKLVEDL